jgi:hypothetical protein
LLLIYVLIITYFNIATMAYSFIHSIFWALDVYYYSKKANDNDVMQRNLII